MQELASTSAADEPRHILVVDDTIAARVSLAGLLRVLGFIVYEAADADQALTLLSASLPVDCVITDVEMAGSMNGLGLLRHLRNTTPHLPVVLVTGLDLRPQDLGDGVVCFRKPYRPEQLLSHLDTVLAKHESR
ncbi:response regulator receiver domain-containing protein [Tahibacter aquaticus]|uniref:Response regulator receiver domain-containing protein n=1 Tax=Tahibacter aquaticus TaxID=520092 RepID=A0A4R6YTM1_9GAMM|nr:response regulator [Tahibacter aquaticus]TDR41753.1 response regulator receiver domain-containing protein [Tahibacter aquaticus]